MNDVAISVRGLGKRYRLGKSAGGNATYRTLRDEVMQIPARLREALGLGSASAAEEFWALRDVSFEVKRGEVLGVIGRNGAGKSTLLKVLSRIIEPTEGEVDLYGRVGSLLEVGTGFHPELTGRENVFLSGAIQGMRRHEVRARLDEIVAFAGVEQFVDQPVKAYSSGMYARLAFSVAAHLETEVLIVDEVLAVGDAEFQKRCLSKMAAVAGGEGRTVLFVSHNIAAIRQLCSRAVYLKSGRLISSGDVNAAVELYGAEQGPLQTEFTREMASGAICAIESVRVMGEWAADRTAFVFGRPITVEININLSREQRVLQVALRVSTGDGVPILTTSNFDGAREAEGLAAGRHRFYVDLPPLFAPGTYKLTIALCDPQRNLFDLVEDVIGFSVDKIGSLSMDLQDGRRGCLELSIPWKREK